jgi:methyltransferase
MVIVSSAAWYTLLVVLVGLIRLVELSVAQRNLRWARERGGVETGAGHYPVMVVLHTGLLIGAALEVALGPRPFLPGLGWPMFVLVLAAQGLRWWCIRTLGGQWNTRILVVPGLSRIDRGPYRHLPHPNYVAVVVEGFALPLVHTAWMTALTFTVLNAGLLSVRINAENRALRQLGGEQPVLR